MPENARAAKCHVNTSPFDHVYRRQWLLAMSIGLALFAFNVTKALHCGQITGCVDMYWANYWLISYTDGFDRRALLGQVVRTLFRDPIQYVALNALAVAIAAIILCWIYWAYFSRQFGGGRLVPFLIILSGPTSTIFFEVLGDPLHLSFLAVLCYSAVARAVPTVPNAILALLAACVVVLIHEASIFIFLPAIYLIFCITTGREASFVVAAVATVTLAIGIALALNAQMPTGRGLGLVVANGTIAHASVQVLPSFVVLLADELESHFGSLDALQNFACKVLGVSVWPLLALEVLERFHRNELVPKVFRSLLLLSLPLYVIAHDWGRFTIYTLMLSLLVSAVASGKESPGVSGKFLVRVDLPDPLKRKVFGQNLVLLFPLFYFAHPDYRLDGLTRDNLIYALAGLALVALYRAGAFRRR
jgi:hypothetical protein